MTEKEIWDEAYKRIFKFYGDMPDLRIISRFYSEKQAFMQYEVGKYFYDLAKLRCEAEEAGERLIVKAPVASCLVAYLLGTTDENPLPAHYYCPKCKTVLWMEGRCVFDLRDRTCVCGEMMKPDGFDIPFETYLPYAKKLKTADTVPENYQQLFNSILSHFQRSLLDTANVCKRLEKSTGVCIDSIDLNDREVTHRLLTGNFEKLAGIGGEKVIKQMITLAHPLTYQALLKVIGLAHGTCTWRHNAEHLIADGVSLADIPATRDEVFMTIRDAMHDCDFHDTGFAIDVANKARRGYYREHGMDDYTNGTLSMLGFDSWFGSYIRTTHYMSTKALAVLELKYSIILNWYQIYYPRDYQQIIADYNV
jgi:DNA polymerase III alpha subunit (gram-positive type)